MEIKFNLEDSKIFIPSGRLMNVKDNLKWKEIEITAVEQKELKEKIDQVDIKINTDFNDITNKQINTILKDSVNKEGRYNAYKKIGRQQIIRPEFFAEIRHDLTEELKEELPAIFELLKSNPEVMKRLEKYQTLKTLIKNQETKSSKPKM